MFSEEEDAALLGEGEETRSTPASLGLGEITRETFKGVNGRTKLPLSRAPEFKGLRGEMAGMVSFPGGRGVAVIYGMSATTGAEKPIVEPNVKDKD